MHPILTLKNLWSNNIVKKNNNTDLMYINKTKNKTNTKDLQSYTHTLSSTKRNLNTTYGIIQK